MLHNVTSATFDHQCSAPDCEHKRANLAHAEVEQVSTSRGVVLVISCPDGHRECFNMELTAEDEQKGSPIHQHQARQIRQLMQHLGLPLVEGRSGPQPSPGA